MRILIAILFVYISFVSRAQTYYVFEDDYNGYLVRMELAKANKFKTFSIISYKNENDKHGKVTTIEKYDSTGKISSREEPSFCSKNYCTSIFYYDSLDRLISIFKRYCKRYYSTMNIGIDSNGKAKYIVEGNQKHVVLGDTLYYGYNENGLVLFRHFSGHRDTLYSIYKSNGKLMKFSYKANDTIENRIFDKNGCVNGDTEDTISIWPEMRYTVEYDSFCNVTSWIEKWYANGKEIIISKGENKYEHRRLTEEIVFRCPKSDYTKSKGKLRFSYHTKYEYYSNGLLKQAKHYNKSGKLTGVVKYVYELY